MLVKGATGVPVDRKCRNGSQGNGCQSYIGGLIQIDVHMPGAIFYFAEQKSWCLMNNFLWMKDMGIYGKSWKLYDRLWQLSWIAPLSAHELSLRIVINLLFMLYDESSYNQTASLQCVKPAPHSDAPQSSKKGAHTILMVETLAPIKCRFYPVLWN